MRERVAADAAVDLAQHARAHRLVERRDEVVARQRAERLEQAEVELAPDHRRRPRRPRAPDAGSRRRREVTSRTPSGTPAVVEIDAALERAGRVAQVAHDLLDEERVALGLAVQRRDEVRRGASAPSIAASARRPRRARGRRASTRVKLSSRRSEAISSRQRVAALELGVAVGAEEHRAARLRRSHEMAQELQRRAVGPVQVVEDEQQRGAAGELGEQRRERVEQALATSRRRRPRRRHGPGRAARPSSGSSAARSAARGPSRCAGPVSAAPPDQPRSISSTGWYGAEPVSSKRP